MNLEKASRALIALKVGPKEGLALSVILSMDGKAQASDIHAALGGKKENARAVLSSLLKKNLCVAVENPGGYSFYKATPELKKRARKAEKVCA